MPKLEACKECGGLRFMVVTTDVNRAEIRKGQVVIYPLGGKSNIVSLACQSCGTLHDASEFRFAA